MATYIPNATQTTEPVESRTVESAALEFRTLKASINGRIEDVQDDLDAEIVNRIAGDANLQTQNNNQDVRIQAIEAALLAIGEGGLPGTVYVQRFSGTGAQTVFTLDVSVPTSALIDIFISGSYQNKDTFTVVDKVLTFSEAPPAGTDNVEVVVSITIANVETDASLVGYYPGGIGAVTTNVQTKLRESVSVKDFIPVGTDTANTNCAPYINAAYAAARTLGVKVVFWPSATYKITNQIDATGVSTQGDNATLLGVLSSAVSNAAFQWGGDDCYVTGMVFDLSNTNAALEMQGVLNGTNNASRQRFFNNTIISRTSKASGASSIYGLWCMGTGLSGLYVYGNTFNATSYGFQLNNQDAAGRDVNTNPLGNPTYDVFAYDNEFIDASLGINTPHIFCNNVQLHNNTFRQINKTMDLPLNIAHVSGLVVSGNIVACNSASANGAIHIEDVSQDATVTGNVVRLSADNSGIFISNQSGVSQDAQPGRKVVVTGNHCYSSSSSGDAAGIGYFDVQASGCRISGNHIQSFARGVDIVGKHSVSDNTLQDCGIGIVFSDDSNGVSLDNVFVNCTTVARGANGATTVIQGGQIRADTFEFTKTNNNIYLLSNVTFRRDSNTTLAANTPFTICPLPASYKFDGSVNILFSSGLGFSKNNINFNGTTFTYTRVADAQVSSLGGLTLTKSGAELQASSSVASGTTRIAVQIDGLVY